jgi:hypothetical protein
MLHSATVNRSLIGPFHFRWAPDYPVEGIVLSGAPTDRWLRLMWQIVVGEREIISTFPIIDFGV